MNARVMELLVGFMFFLAVVGMLYWRFRNVKVIDISGREVKKDIEEEKPDPTQLTDLPMDHPDRELWRKDEYPF